MTPDMQEIRDSHSIVRVHIDSKHLLPSCKQQAHTAIVWTANTYYHRSRHLGWIECALPGFRLSQGPGIDGRGPPGEF